MLKSSEHSETKPFESLGYPVRADETRSAAVCRNVSGEERIVIAARGYLLIVDPDNGSCRQLPFPDLCREYPFAAMSTRSGLLCTGAGTCLYVLDPFKAEYIARFEVPPGEEHAGFAFAEDERGTVYATTYPGSYLLSKDAAMQECRVVTRLDSDRTYAMTLAAGSDGWIYAGLGTSSPAVAAVHADSGEVKTITVNGNAAPGSAQVHRGQDGRVYARIPNSSHPSAAAAENWYIIENGQERPIPEASVSPSLYRGEGYRKLHQDLSNGRSLLSWELSEMRISIQHADGTRSEIPLHHEGNAAELSPIFAGPDGNLYGTSNHPLHFYRYEPDRRRIMKYGSDMIQKGGGGNIAAYASQGSKIIGAAYAGGLIHVMDTSRDWEGIRQPASRETDMVSPSLRNPRLIYADNRVHRPRCAVSLNDGIHVLYGGFPGYGAVGGGLGIVNVDEESVTMLGHEQVIPEQSTVSLAVLPEGIVIGGTSIETPGGGHSSSKEAVLYAWDWASRSVTGSWVPIAGAREISGLCPGHGGDVYGITSDSILFRFDVKQGKVVSRHDLSSWGSVVRNGMMASSRDGKPIVIGLLSRSLFMITAGFDDPVRVAALPVPATCGLARIGNDIYYAAGAELWRFHWEEGASRHE